jgi:hypothetical protein
MLNKRSNVHSLAPMIQLLFGTSLFLFFSLHLSEENLVSGDTEMFFLVFVI